MKILEISFCEECPMYDVYHEVCCNEKHRAVIDEGNEFFEDCPLKESEEIK